MMKHILLALAALCLSPLPALAMGSDTFSYLRVQADVGVDDDETVFSWDLEGWVGGDHNKLTVKSEGEAGEDHVEDAEVQLLWSRMIAPFWDLQAGVRHDLEPESLSHAVLGVEGLAPYLFEIEAAGFLSENGDLTARAEVEYELVFTQRLIGSPFLEANIAADEVPELEYGAGLATAEVGFQLRYEFTRKFAPYIEVSYERAFGETEDLRNAAGDETEATVARAGLRLIF